MVFTKLKKLGQTLWTHKKKTAAGGIALIFIGRYLLRLKRDADIRTIYAKQAQKYGTLITAPDDRQRRIAVLVNSFANERRVYDNFKTNALPLLNLAGLEVNIIRSEDEDQLEALAAAIDTNEADALYIVGGDGTISKALSGIFRNRDKSELPIGIFPGGNENRSLLSLVPDVFSAQSDVRRFCESAMAVIEETKRNISVARCQIEGFENGEEMPRPVYGLSDFNLGWFLHMELKTKKLWYWGKLKRRFAYFWEMIKRYPEKMEIPLEYEEFCPGCQKCRIPVTVEASQSRWWHFLTGKPTYKGQNLPVRDFKGVINDECGVKKMVDIKASDFIAENVQHDDTNKLRVRTGGSEAGRLGVMCEGWRRCRSGLLATSPDPKFYENDFFAKSILISFQNIPDFIKKFSIFGEVVNMDGNFANRRIRFETTDKKIDVYLPSDIRVNLNEV